MILIYFRREFLNCQLSIVNCQLVSSLRLTKLTNKDGLR